MTVEVSPQPPAAPAVRETNPFAIVAFVTAFFVPVAGIVLGIIALRQISASGGTQDGRGLATWAVAIGGVITALIALYVLLIVGFSVWLLVVAIAAVGS